MLCQYHRGARRALGDDGTEPAFWDVGEARVRVCGA